LCVTIDSIYAQILNDALFSLLIMSNRICVFFLFSVLVTGLIINPSTFHISFNDDSISDDSELYFNLLSFAFATKMDTEDDDVEDFHHGLVGISNGTSVIGNITSTEGNITLCHIPPGNQTQSHSITVASSSVSAHLAHGDYLGICDEDSDNEIENIHEQLTIFVKESRSLFKEQKEETRIVIKECQISLIASEPSQRDDIRKKCRDNLDDIKESYKELRKIYNESFKEFGKSMDIAIREAKGLHINNSEKIVALSDIKSSLKSNADVEKIKELRKSIDDELKADKKQLHEEKKTERKQMRENQKEERDTMKEQNEKERDTMKEQNEKERDTMKEQKQEERDTMKEEKKK